MDRILSLAAEYDMLPPGGLVLVALSGGGDSVALLHYLKTHGVAVAAAHFDHRLRPNSGEDAAFARDLCARWGVPFYLGVWARRPAGNTEANARTARYAFLEETAGRIGALRIATAHSAEDDLETVLLHLTRGCGLRGLTGISPRRGKLVRPMLRTTRSAISAYLEEQGLPFVTDQTNLDDSYARNRIRHQVLPVLESLNPRVAEAASRMTASLRQDYDYLTAQAAQAGAEGRDREELPPALRCRLPEDRGEEKGPAPVLSIQNVEIGERVDTPLWTVETFLCDTVPAAPPTPLIYHLRLPLGTSSPPLQLPSDTPSPPLRLTLRPRQTGDFLHPPFRTGKTVKKWMNEVKVPREERELTPVLELNGAVAAVAGLGPQEELLAAPGGPGLRVEWTKR